MAHVMLTTTDNPYNPFTDFDAWYAYDEMKGYHTCSYLARIAKISDELDDKTNQRTIEDAIDEILSFNLLGIYKKVFKEEVEK